MKHFTKGPKETQKLGYFLLNRIGLRRRRNAIVVSLSGDLGAGKTVLVRGLARILGIKSKIKSPTFTLMKKYKIPRSKNSKFLYHLDCYRLKNHKDLLVLGIDDILKDKENIVMIEWPERVKKILPKKHIKVSIDHVNENTRKISIK